MAELAEALDIIILLALDIDQTVLMTGNSISLSKQFIDEQNYILHMIDEWLNEGRGRERVFLSYNTSRVCAGEDWVGIFQTQHLPLPHALISSNGLNVVLTNTPPEFMTTLNDPKNRQIIYDDMSRMQEVYGHHQDAVLAGISSELYAQDKLTYHEAMGEGIKQTPTTEYIARGDYYSSLKHSLTTRAHIPGAKKGCFSREYPDATFYYDRVVNKGSALTLLIKHIVPCLSAKGMLFTAGNDLYDQSMLFMHLQSQALLRPEIASQEQLLDDYQEIGITRDDLKLVEDVWQAGILSYNPYRRPLYCS